MSIGRRKLLAASLGAAQLALLDRFDLFSRRARAHGSGDRPTKLLCVWVPGGLNHELMWCPFPAADIAKYVPPFAEGGADAAHVANFDGSDDADADAEYRRVRGVVTWDWANPSAGYPEFSPNGYAWAAPEYRLFENTVVVHGVDQGTASHPSGIVAGMCGLANANFSAPAIPAVVANYFAELFPDRALPSVVIGGALKAPALGLSAAANPTTLSSLDDLVYTLSQDLDAWEGLRTRTEQPDVDFAGGVGDGTVPLTAVDAAVMAATRQLRGSSSVGSDAVLESLHDQYRLLSKTLARDVVDQLAGTPGVEYLPTAMPWTPGESRFGWRIGYADDVVGDGPYLDSFDLALRLLKSDLCTAVTFKLDTLEYLDTHGGPYMTHRNYLRGSMEALGRLLIEMKLTPCPSDPSRTLLDETLVYVFSDFGRTFHTSGAGGSDHYPMTSAVYVNGNLAGNRMIGGFAGGDPNGLPLRIREESGESGMRAARAQDVAASVYTTMGMGLTDFFLPGGYGAFEGLTVG